jgi:hypothetical protein
MIHAPQSSPAFRRLPASLALLCAMVAGASLPLAAQQRRTVAAVTLHKDPGGTRLARLPDPAPLVTARRRAGWTEVVLDGWVSARLLAADRREGFDLAVRGDDVRLRSAPNGDEVALLAKGMLVDRVQARDGWTRVRRNVWVPDAAVRAPAAASTARTAKPPAPRNGARPDSAAAYRPMEQGRGQGAAPAGAASPEAVRVEMGRLTPVYGAPDGPQAGTLQPGTTARVVSRAGEWVRIQTEVWVREADTKPATGDAMAGVTAAEVRANPSRYVGQVLEWRMQYVSTAVADELRPEMPPGQPYVLARGPLPEPGFVYMMVSPEELARIRALPALTELTVRVAVRAARSRFLATPVVELRALLSPTATTR